MAIFQAGGHIGYVEVDAGNGSRFASQEDEGDADDEREEREDNGHQRRFGQRQVPTPHDDAAQNDAENTKRHLDGSDVKVGRRGGNAELNLEILGEKNGETRRNGEERRIGENDEKKDRIRKESK